MRRIGKVLIVLLIVLLVVLVVLSAAGVYFVRRPWPKEEGNLTVDGVSAPVEVFRDQWGVPHIYAQNEHDLFLAQGFVHAQDRLWQMEFNRRVGSGTLSEALGEATLGIDRFMRTIGLRRAAEKDWALLDAETRALLEAYAEGVNAFVASDSAQLPLEFTILGITPAPWTPVDTLTWGKMMSYGLGGNYGMELLRARMIAALGPKAAQELLPPYAAGAPVIVPPESRDYSWLKDASFARVEGLPTTLGNYDLNRGSNNWVVHGSRTSTGMPMLADDTHLDLDMPSVWYENGLHGGRFDSVGFTFPGVPMVIIGHNGQIAWGVTNLPADVQDFYIERLDDPAHPTRYQFDGQWLDLEVMYETISIEGQDPVSLSVMLTHHGPIMNRVLGLEEAEPMALRWTALDGTQLLKAVSLINLAQDWDQFRQALSYWDAPSQNFVYADVEGNIGYQTPGKIPIRSSGHQGLVPVPGWVKEYDWQGYIPFEELPTAHNPETGYIATANNKVTSADYPHYLATEWSAPYRAQRISELLAGTNEITIADMQETQADTFSAPAEAMRPHVLAIEPTDELQAAALAELEGWDLLMESDRAGASVFKVWYWFLVQDTFGDELGADLLEEYLGTANMHVPLLIDLLQQPGSPWFDDVSTPQVELRDDILRRSLAKAANWMSQELGPDPADWEWGRLHTKTFVHQPLGQSGITLLERLFNSTPIPARGSNFTVDAAWVDYNQPFEMTGGASQRFIADLSDLSRSLTMHTTGQSGHLFHRHREDMIPRWQNVEYHPMLSSREAVEANADAVLTLTPP